MNQFRRTSKKRKLDKVHRRRVMIKHPTKFISVLLISNSENKPLKQRVEELFSSSRVYHLFPREFKEDRTVGFYYSVHGSDFNLTGNLKNDKLRNLEKMPIELLIDLSFGSKLLDFFVDRSNSSLKVGKINSEKVTFYDLFMEFEATEVQSIENIYAQLNTLTEHANE